MRWAFGRGKRVEIFDVEVTEMKTLKAEGWALLT